MQETMTTVLEAPDRMEILPPAASGRDADGYELSFAVGAAQLTVVLSPNQLAQLVSRAMVAGAEEATPAD